MSNKSWFLIIAFLGPFLGFSQDCGITITGFVRDVSTQRPLETVNIFLAESKQGGATNSEGYFSINHICPGDYHLTFSHIGCAAEQIFLNITSDTLLEMYMEHTLTTLDDVLVFGSNSTRTLQSTESVGEQEIADQAYKDLSGMLESVSGVSILKNGNGIAKPIVHGLFGSRLLILNNGITQSGQQWGNDHSPEIDPLMANKIRVIKGVAGLEYLGAGLGSIVSIEPGRINHEPHLHGKANYSFESNGLANGLNLQLQQYAPAIAWKVNGTIRKSGDRKSADYYLRNTGAEEANFAIQLEKVINPKLFTDLYFSSFNTTLGVLRGSHIGNLTDLEEAFTRDVPFFTSEQFSYTIDAPKQQVSHQLLKLHSKYFFQDEQWLELTLSGQFDSRKEFDVRRGGRSDIPALALKQLSYYLEAKYNQTLKEGLLFKSGLQLNIIDNTNALETGILPLIPDYLAYESGAFAMVSRKLKKSIYELGIRYDHIYQSVPTISQTGLREIVHYSNNFQNIKSSFGWSYQLSRDLDLTVNLGYAGRNPAINELYSGGLHQGVSGIEEGNPQLRSEESIKSTMTLSGNMSTWIFFESLVYYQRINDYIYLNPQDQLRLTIRGAFPLFRYEQTDAEIYGMDLTTQMEVSKSLGFKVSYSYIRGTDLTMNQPLIYMPSNNLSLGLSYQFTDHVKLGKLALENSKIEVENRSVFKQRNLLASQDFTLPPEGYNLFNLIISADLPLGGKRMRLIVRGNNLFNVSYRDYLNRQRYFADDMGRNIIIGLSMKF
jgi:iron complex outermembrane receptor protein